MVLSDRTIGLDPDVKFKLYRLCVWSTVLVFLGNTVFFFVIGQLFPPPSPTLSAEEITAVLMAKRNGILWCTVGLGFLAPFFYFFAVITSIQISRIEGHFGLLSYLQLATAVVAPTGWLYPLATLSTAVYRPERAPELVQLLSDNYWLTYIGVAFIFSINIFVIGLSALLDRRQNPVFPRWFGYSNMFFAMAFAPGTLIYAFMDGPLAWDGIFAVYIPSCAFPLWQISMVYCLLKAIKQEEAEERFIRNSAEPLRAGRVATA